MAWRRSGRMLCFSLIGRATSRYRECRLRSPRPGEHTGCPVRRVCRSHSRRRTIRMPGLLISALKNHQTRQLEERLAAGAAWQDSGLVFASPIGTALEQRNVTREFLALLVAAHLPVVRFPDLRHTVATLLLAQGVDPRTIM